MNIPKEYRYLAPRPESLYRQLFIKGTRIRAEILYRLTIPAEDGELYTPEEVAESYNLPLVAVLEADFAREERLMEASGINHPEYKYNPKKYHRILTPQEWTEIFKDDPLPR